MPAKSKKVATVVDTILAKLSQGIPLTQICKENHMPDPIVVAKWAREDETFGIAYARAREVGFDAIAEEGLKIVDDITEDPASRRVRSDYRLKLLAKWDPKRYGEMLKLADHDGSSLNKAAEIEKRRQKVINDG
jgi:hypothetical protein